MDPEVHIVAELVGGTTLAKTIILTALKLGKPVITANKALLSAHGEELVRGGASEPDQPLLRSQRLRRHPDYQIAARRVRGQPDHASLRHRQRHVQLYPDEDEAGGGGFRRGVEEAQAQGYAEAEASLDIDGLDAQHKIGILASLAHGFWVDPKNIHVEGIRNITALDIRFAEQLGYTIKLLGIIKSLARLAGRKQRRAHKSRFQSIRR